MLVAQILTFLLGIVIVVATLASAVRTFVLPRAAPDVIVWLVFRGILFRLFNLRLKHAQSYEERDRIMALYAPLGLMALLPVWLTAILLGYMLMYWAVGAGTVRTAFALSGSALLTLGTQPPGDVATAVLAFSEATIGLIMIALLIAYLPTIYTAFARREAAVTMLEVRAGSPPSAVEMLARFGRIGGWDRLHETWAAWESWFADIEESHTSLAALAFFRSPQGHRSWVTAAGAVLDAAALTISTLDLPRDAQAALCIRAGYLALRHIASYFRLPYDPAPRPDDPISIRRDEFEAACEQLATQGVPLKADRDQAWRDFSGWRVNYDTVLLELAALTMAPYAPWSSDRSSRQMRAASRRKARLNRRAVRIAEAQD
jgi:hypothetical protein